MRRLSTLIIPSLKTVDHSIKQSIVASIQKLPDSTVKSVRRISHRIGVSDETIRLSIRLRLTVEFLHEMYIKYKQMLVIDFIFGLLWTVGRDSSVGIATRYRPDGPGIESRWGARFSAPVQTGHGAQPASYTVGTGSFPVVNRPDRGV